MKLRIELMVLMTSLALPAIAAAGGPVGTAFSYQGYLTDGGVPVDDVCDARFGLWDAEIGGAQIGVDVEQFALNVVSGQLTALIDFGTAFGGEARWLNVEVKCSGDVAYVPLDPRQALTPTPYAIGLSLPYSGSSTDAGNALSITNTGLGRAANFQIANAASTSAAVNALNNGSGPAGAFLNDAGGDGVQGTAFVAAGVHGVGGQYGVRGEATSGAGIQGEATSGAGVHGEATTGTGVHGVHADLTGAAAGVHGETSSNDVNAAGVYGEILDLTPGDLAAGVRGVSKAAGSSKGYGVYGSHSGAGSGVYGSSAGGGGNGVYGYAEKGVGVRGISDSAELGAYGVSGLARADAVDRGTMTYGVYGESRALDGIGVKGYHYSTAGTGTGVLGVTHSEEDGAIGVHGKAEAAATGGLTTTYGVYGESAANVGIGVYGTGKIGLSGDATMGFGRGVEGKAWAAGDMGVYAYSGPGAWYALRADNPDGEAAYITGTSGVRAEATTSYGVQASSEDFHGVKGSTNSAAHYGGWFTNDAGGVGLKVGGDAEISGTATVEVLEITGADLAERFEFSEAAEPGTVVEIDPDNPGQLRISREAYNQRVAGIVSGANELNAGVILGNLPGGGRRVAVALSGRVWVHCDATERAVSIGNFMTSAQKPGHAMPVADASEAHGAILGKAMTPLAKGESGMVLVLVNLQ